MWIELQRWEGSARQKRETEKKETDKDKVVGGGGRMTHAHSEWSKLEEELNGCEECQTYS